jgi:hypothetical protein
MAELADPLFKAAPAKAGESGTRASGAASSESASGAQDWRRQGRLEQNLEQISAGLIPLLRTETAQYVDASDALDPARGIVVGFLLSTLLWVGLALIL